MGQFTHGLELRLSVMYFDVGMRLSLAQHRTAYLTDVETGFSGEMGA